jgi:hypothetical protein
MTKQCSGCGIVRPVADYYERAERPGVLRSQCKACMRAYVDRNRERVRSWHRDWARAHPEKARQRYEAHAEQVKAAAVAWQRQSRAARPEAWRARATASSAVRRALQRGALVRPTTCEECRAADVAIEAAHHDYALPLDVRWLCRRCHRRWDKADPKLLKEA